jgi:hypothetical protein
MRKNYDVEDLQGFCGLIETAEANLFRHSFMLKTTFMRKNYDEVFIRNPRSH